MEADCLLCHLPTYDYGERQAQLRRWNLRWAPAAGARLAAVTGSVKDARPIEVTYDTSRFDADGVHLPAGLKCVDCHPAGRSARDPRISSREEHQFAKGDDPGGLVRNDLDDGIARNHYGFLEVMGYDDKPTEAFRPKLFRHEGKLYPGNRVHSTWPGLEVEGQEALAQPRMGGYRPAIDDRFLLSRVILDASLRLSSRHRVFLGEELDLRAVWRARPRLELMAGTSFFWAGPFLIATGRARDARWQMLQATWSW
jgi:hypothetical protein